ncbi:Serine/threonine-protein phosphatase SIT4 [Phlyctema vagabunda]|uniref:Serine/threonine-protein phosphatase n=1 Tax=Phlyctema vagabunda TaxID=108571 RepID=A0ABR4PDZ9_9HELO
MDQYSADATTVDQCDYEIELDSLIGDDFNITDSTTRTTSSADRREPAQDEEQAPPSAQPFCATRLPPLNRPLPPIPTSPQPSTTMASNVPQPGPARLTARSSLDEWLVQAKQCKYLPENIMKQLCEIVKECLMEESNIQPVATPVTICGDIHGQFYDLLELFRVAGGMPGETDVQAPTTIISNSNDLEPPTEITDPKLKKKIRSSDSGIGSAGDTGDEDEDEPRGRPRTAGSNRPDSSGGDSAIGVNTVSGNGEQNFIFLGDFVDRGYFSLETLTLLLCLKAKYPDRITLVRGNHESRQITQVYGFYEECQQKYGNASVWKACCQVFDFLVLAAIVDGEILCVHGGLSPEIRTVDQIRVVARAQEIPHEGAFCDLVWSDPEDVPQWSVSPRGAGWLFGAKVAKEFNQVNDLKLIARAHQLVNEGYKYHFDEKSVVTVWSAPNYCYRCGNVASIMNVGEDLDPKFTIFSAVPEDQRAVPAGRRGAGEYFL